MLVIVVVVVFVLVIVVGLGIVVVLFVLRVVSMKLPPCCTGLRDALELKVIMKKCFEKDWVR